MPLMKFERSRSGPPVASMSGSRVKSSRSITRSPGGPDGRRGRNGVRPRRTRGGGWGRAGRRSGKGPRRRLVPVGRVVEEEHLVPGCELLSREHGVLDDRAAHPDDRRGPPHDLVDPGGADPGRVGLPQRPLVGVLGEGQQPVGDGGAGRLVPGRQEQDEEGRKLGVGQRLAVDVGGDESGGQVVGRGGRPGGRRARS